MNIIDQINTIRRSQTLSNSEKDMLEDEAIKKQLDNYKTAISQGVFQIRSLNLTGGKLSRQIELGE